MHTTRFITPLTLLALAGVALACPEHTDAPTPQIICHTPPSADLPPGVQLQFPRRAAPTPRINDGTITFTVTFNDGGLFAPWQAQLTSHLIAAGNQWAQYLGGSGQIDIVVVPFSGPRFGGRSNTTTFVGIEQLDGSDTRIWMQGAAGKLRTGVDPNGSQPDIEISIGSDLSYLANELWFDPNPNARTATVPTNKTDAMSVCLHELGHAFGFNGWRDWSTGELPPPFGNPLLPYASTFDRYADVSGSFFHFGPATTAQYGGDTPITNGNIFHYGNAAPQPGSDLIPYLMNGVVFFRGQRYFISDLELATLLDANVVIERCYANCDGSTTTPVLGAADFSCFLTKFRAGNPYANCDGSTTAPVLGAADFSCFLGRFRSGC